MESTSTQTYYVPHDSKYPIWTSVGLILTMSGLGIWLLDVKNDASDPTQFIFAGGFLVLCTTLFFWFKKVVEENFAGLVSPQLDRSFVWGMMWFIVSEIMFFAAFFGALFYLRFYAVPWLGGDGDKGISGTHLWPEFEAVWPLIQNPDPALFEGPKESMASPGVLNWGGYLPFWNTVILLSSSVTVHIAHTALKEGNRSKLNLWMIVTVALGIIFLFLQAWEYIHAYNDLGLTLDSGIYGSTFFMLTGFHGFHVTLGTFMLFVVTWRCLKGHFDAKNQFGFEAVSWYWHFVDVVWVGLFLFIYII